MTRLFSATGKSRPRKAKADCKPAWLAWTVFDDKGNLVVMVRPFEVAWENEKVIALVRQGPDFKKNLDPKTTARTRKEALERFVRRQQGLRGQLKRQDQDAADAIARAEELLKEEGHE